MDYEDVSIQQFYACGVADDLLGKEVENFVTSRHDTFGILGAVCAGIAQGHKVVISPVFYDGYDE